MYTIENFCFGIDLNSDKISKDIRDMISDLDLEYSSNCLDPLTLESSYHGGVTSNDDYFPGGLGIEIGDSDGGLKNNYFKTVIKAKEEESKYLDLYNEQLPKLINYLEEILSEEEFHDDPSWIPYKKPLEDFIEIVKTSEPEFFSYQSSS